MAVPDARSAAPQHVEARHPAGARAGAATKGPRRRCTGRSRPGRASQDRRRCGSPDDDTPVPAYGGSVPDPTPPVALTIAGSDSGGGAGAQADLKTFAALRVHGTCALTAVTAQNTAEVRGVVALEPAFVRQQVETVLDDFDVRSVKTGMLATAGIVADGGRPRRARPASPAWSSTRSWSRPRATRLLEPAGIAAYLERLLPHALVVTPNLREAAVLGDTDVDSLRTLEARVAVAERIRAHRCPLRRREGRPPHRVGGRRRGRPRRGRRPAGRAGGHRQRPWHRVLAVGRGGGAPGPGGRRCPTPSRRPRTSWPGPWPEVPAGGSARARAPRPFRVVRTVVGLSGHE